MKWHINLKELEAAKMAVDLIMLPGNIISLYTDSTAAVAFVNRQGGTRSRLLNALALRLWKQVLAKGG